MSSSSSSRKGPAIAINEEGAIDRPKDAMNTLLQNPLTEISESSLSESKEDDSPEATTVKDGSNIKLKRGISLDREHRRKQKLSIASLDTKTKENINYSKKIIQGNSNMIESLNPADLKQYNR